MPKLALAKKMQLQKSFRDFDTSGDSKLDFEEMKMLLRRGNPNMSESDLRTLYGSVDTDNSGSVDFEEFVGYLYGKRVHYVKAPLVLENKFKEYADNDEMDLATFGLFCTECGLLNEGFRMDEIGPVFAKVLPRKSEKISSEVRDANGISQFDKLLCNLADKKNITPQEIYQIIVTRSQPTEEVNARVVATWDAETAQALSEELGLDLEPLIDFLESGGKMMPYRVEGASEVTRWEYVNWLCSFLEAETARKLETAIAKLQVCNSQELFGQSEDYSYVVPEALRTAFLPLGEENPAEVLEHRRNPATWTAEDVEYLMHELDVDLSNLYEHLEGGRRMRPYELLRASPSTRWDYWDYLMTTGLEPAAADELEKHIARTAVMNAQDSFGPDAESNIPDALESAFESPIPVLPRVAGTWDAGAATEMAGELDLDLQPLVSYLEDGNRMMPFDLEDCTATSRWKYVSWLSQCVGLEPETARQLERAIGRCAVMHMQDELGGEYQPPTALKSAFDEEEDELVDHRVVTSWSENVAEDFGNELGIDMEALTTYLEAGNKMRPYVLDGASLKTRWQYWEWLHNLGMGPWPAGQLEKAIGRCVVSEAQENDPDYRTPAVLQSVFLEHLGGDE